MPHAPRTRSAAARRALATALALVLLGPGASRAACSCPAPESVTDALAHATYVFAGRVMSVGPSVVGAWPPWGTLVVVDVAATAVWKGAVSTRMTVFTPASPADCGYPFVPGQDVLVYAGVIDLGVAGPWYHPLVSTCSRTAPLADNPDLALLPPPDLPVPVRRDTWGALKSRYR